MTGWCVVVNASAGSGRTTRQHAEAALAATGLYFEVLAPSSRAAMTAEIANAVRAGQRHFVAVGGDGTVNALVNDLLAHEWTEPPVVGVLPAGTGCDLVRTFGISQRMDQAAAHLLGSGTYLIDVGWVRGEWGEHFFVNVGEAGVAAAGVERAARLPSRLGRIRYPAGLALALPRFRRTHVDVVGDRRRFSGEALAVIFANGQFFGGGFNVAPKATLVDGLLDVQIITASKRRAGTLVPRVYRGLHLMDRGVRRFTSGTVRVETAEPWPVEVDGEPIGNTPVEAGVAPGRIALKI